MCLTFEKLSQCQVLIGRIDILVIWNELEIIFQVPNNFDWIHFWFADGKNIILRKILPMFQGIRGKRGLNLIKSHNSWRSTTKMWLTVTLNFLRLLNKHLTFKFLYYFYKVRQLVKTLSQHVFLIIRFVSRLFICWFNIQFRIQEKSLAMSRRSRRISVQVCLDFYWVISLIVATAAAEQHVVVQTEERKYCNLVVGEISPHSHCVALQPR